VNPLSKLLFVAALLLAVVGLGVAVVQPGDLGDEASTETAQLDATTTSTTTNSTTTSPPSSTSSPTTSSPTTSVAGDAEETPTPPGGDADGASGDGAADDDVVAGDGSTDGGSGLAGGDDAPADTEDGLAATGGTSMVGAALAAALAGLALRRRSA